MIKSYITIMIILCFIVGCVHSGEYTHTKSVRTRYYNSMGQYQGYSLSTKQGQRYYNNKGQYQGYSLSDKRGARYYDAKGTYQGRSKP